MDRYAKHLRNCCSAKKALKTQVFSLLLLALAACGSTEKALPPLALDSLIMPVPEGIAVARIELKSLIRDTRDPTVQGRAATERAHLANMGIRATGYFKYPLESGGGYRVKVNIYDRPVSLQKDWDHRYPPHVQEGAQPLAGISGFFLPGKAAVMHDKTVLVEITSYKKATGLAEFAAHFERHLKGLRLTSTAKIPAS